LAEIFEVKDNGYYFKNLQLINFLLNLWKLIFVFDEELTEIFKVEDKMKTRFDF